MSISFFLMYVFQIFLFPLGGLPAWIQVSRLCLSLLDINPFCFETFFLSCGHISFSSILPNKYGICNFTSDLFFSKHSSKNNNNNEHKQEETN